MKSLSDILDNFDPLEDRYISREYQSYGVYLATKLEDDKHKSLYIKFARTMPRPMLEEALRFVVDSSARRKSALFMWKLKDIGAFAKKKDDKEKMKKVKRKNK